MHRLSYCLLLQTDGWYRVVSEGSISCRLVRNKTVLSMLLYGSSASTAPVLWCLVETEHESGLEDVPLFLRSGFQISELRHRYCSEVPSRSEILFRFRDLMVAWVWVLNQLVPPQTFLSCGFLPHEGAGFPHLSAPDSFWGDLQV
jgi:hypothetical protein